jgi:hypothetical protein
MPKMTLKEPTQKLYFVKKATQRYDPGRVGRITRRMELEPEEKKVIRKRVERVKYTQRGYTEPGVKDVSALLKGRPRIIRRDEPTTQEEIDYEQRIKRKALPPSQREYLAIEEGKARMAEQERKARKAERRRLVEEAILAFPGLGRQGQGAQEEISAQESKKIGIKDEPLTAQMAIDNTGANRRALRDLLNLSEGTHYTTSISMLEKMTSQQIQDKLQGTRANLTPSFVAKIERYIKDKEMRGGSLMMKKKRGRPAKGVAGAGFGSFLGHIAKKAGSAIVKHAVDYVKKDPVGALKGAFEVGKNAHSFLRGGKIKPHPIIYKQAKRATPTLSQMMAIKISHV